MASRSKNKRKKNKVQRLVKKFGPICGICGRPIQSDATVDHIIPKSLIDRYNLPVSKQSILNFQLAHKKCNKRKGNKLAKVTIFPTDNFDFLIKVFLLGLVEVEKSEKESFDIFDLIFKKGE